MSKSNQAKVETSNTDQAVVLSGVSEQGTWEAERFVADQQAEQEAAEQPKSTLSAEIIAVIETSGTKSDKIRKLLSMGCKRGEVAKLLNIRYQHVRNVEITPIKRAA